MARRPAAVPLFATDPAPSGVVEPVSSVRQAGFATGDRPPAQWFNWLFSQIGENLDFLRGPTMARWERVEYPGQLAALPNFCDVDNDTTEAGLTAPPKRILIATSDPTSGNRTLQTSEKGERWVDVTDGIATAFASGVRAVRWTGPALSSWLVGTAAGLLYSSPASGQSGSALDGNAWSSCTLPAGVTAIVQIATDGSNAVAISPTKILVGAGTVATFIEATYAGPSRVGNFTDVIFDGAGWVAVTDHGETFTALTATSTWTNAGSPPLGTVSGGSNHGWALRSDFHDLSHLQPNSSSQVIIAFPVNSTQFGWFKSTDHGFTWVAITQPSAVNNAFSLVWDLQFIDGLWILCQSQTPYLSTTNDITDPTQWVSGVMPFHEDATSVSGQAAMGIAYAEGRLLQFWAPGFVLLSDRAVNFAPSPWAPPDRPVPLEDAAYLRGVLITATAPTDGQVPVYNASQNEILWEASPSASGSNVWFGSGSDGAVTVSSFVTLTQNMRYSTLTVTGSGILVTNGFTIECSVAYNAAVGALVGNVGGGGTGGPSGTLAGGSNAGSRTTGVGNNGTDATYTYSGNAGNGGTGTSGAGGNGGAGHSPPANAGNIDSTSALTGEIRGFGAQGWIGGGAGGGSGAGDGTNNGGKGGGGGGVVIIRAKTFNNLGTVIAYGADGETLSVGNVGGGGGGAGGTVIIGTSTLVSLGTIDVHGGAGGSGHGTGTNGTAGAAGTSQVITI